MKKLGRTRDRFGGEDVNPMNYLSNLSDVMLILAVGIMLALVVHWNVDITASGGQAQGNTGENGSVLVDKDHAVAMTDEELARLQEQSGVTGGGESLEKRGEVYYDAETGTYYIVRDSRSNGGSR
ncbi:MAG: hypothetical protein BHW42_03920 [Oscillibacter sp. CAG:241_62_21]|nr:MAG: hypothetical protein BHW42_03920 [Oscillibacter sp. CAG:241_62_21]